MRFQEYNVNWHNTKLRNILKIKSGQDQKQAQCKDGVYNIYGTGGIIGKTNSFLYNKESVGIGRKGTINKPFYFNEPFWTVDTLFYSEIYSGIPKFIYYLFQTINWNLYNQSTGVPSLTSSVIENINVNIPNEDEQYKLSNFLSKIDLRIETQKKIIEEIKCYKNTIINRIFSDRGLLCEGNEVSLSDILIPGSKESVDTSLYSKINVHLNLKGISYAVITREMSDTRPFYLRHKGELIIGKQNYFNGSIAIIPEKYDSTICSNAIMSFTIKNEFDNNFIYYAISNDLFLKYRSHMANGTGQKELSEKEFLKFKINVPSIDMQKNIANSLNSLENKIKNEEKILELYQKQKDYLLNHMFI